MEKAKRDHKPKTSGLNRRIINLVMLAGVLSILVSHLLLDYGPFRVVGPSSVIGISMGFIAACFFTIALAIKLEALAPDEQLRRNVTLAGDIGMYTFGILGGIFVLLAIYIG